MIHSVGENQVNLTLQVKTNAPVQKIEVYDDAIDVYVQSVPRKGKANKEIIEVFSDILDINSTYLQIIRGATSPNKILAVYGMTEDEINQILTKYRPTQTMQ